jgi:hypothetical protein
MSVVAAVVAATESRSGPWRMRIRLSTNWVGGDQELERCLKMLGESVTRSSTFKRRCLCLASSKCTHWIP